MIDWGPSLPTQCRRSPSRNIPTSTARSVRSSSQAIRSSANAQLSEVAPELSDPVGSLEVRQHENVEQLGAWSGAESIEAFPEPGLELIRSLR